MIAVPAGTVLPPRAVQRWRTHGPAAHLQPQTFITRARTAAARQEKSSAAKEVMRLDPA